jgi:predicted MFS family arabinose efflux permease
MPLDKIYIFFALNYLAQGLSGIVYEPLSYLLKDALGLSAGESAIFIGWMTFPFLLKPLLGLLTDLSPFGGRGSHIRLAAAASVAAWLLLAGHERPGYGLLLGLLILVNFGGVACDVICDAVMVEQGQERRRTGIYQAVQIGTLYASLLITGVGGGWLSAHMSPQSIFAVAAIFPSMIFLSASWIRKTAPKRRSQDGLKALWSLLNERRFWFLSGFIFLWSFAPFLGTVQFYYQSEILKLGPVFIGFLSTLGGLAGVLGAIFYGRVIGGIWSAAALVRGAVFIGFPLSLLYVLYTGPVSALIVTFLLGFSGVAFRLALMDLAAQSCPSGAEATTFAVYMSVFNLAAWASNTVGGKLYDFLRLRLSALPDPSYAAVVVLILVGSLCTLACWPLLPWVLDFKARYGVRSDSAGGSISC